jgi:hypothetical protein
MICVIELFCLIAPSLRGLMVLGVSLLHGKLNTKSDVLSCVCFVSCQSSVVSEWQHKLEGTKEKHA